MDTAEARLILQDFSATLESAWSKTRARLILGYFAAHAWRKQCPSDFSGKVMSLHGPDAERLCTFLQLIIPSDIRIASPSFGIPGARASAVGCNHHVAGSYDVALRKPSFDPWQRLSGVANAVTDAANAIIPEVTDFSSRIRASTLAAITQSVPGSGFPVVSLSWAGWGALCTGETYTEDKIPLPDSLGYIQVDGPPTASGVILMSEARLVVLRNSAGKIITKTCKPRHIESAPGFTGKVHVYEVWRTPQTEWLWRWGRALRIPLSDEFVVPNTYGISDAG